MLAIKKILFPTDFSACSEQALAHAIEWARRYDTQLHVFHAVEMDQEDPYNPASYVPENEELWPRMEDRARTAITETLDQHGANDLTIVAAVERCASAARAIVGYVEKNEIDLVIVGTHGRRGVRKMFIGSVAEAVMREAPAPVLAIREQETPRPLEAPERILVPLDFSDWSSEAVCYAKALAGPIEAKVVLLHVVEEVVVPDFYYPLSSALFLQEPEVRKEAGKRLEALYEKTPGPDVPAEFRVIDGRAVSDIVHFAEENEIDLIVIPSHGLSGVQRLLLGSVTDKVLRRTPCPVLTLKPFGRQPLEGVTTLPAEVIGEEA